VRARRPTTRSVTPRSTSWSRLTTGGTSGRSARSSGGGAWSRPPCRPGSGPKKARNDRGRTRGGTEGRSRLGANCTATLRFVGSRSRLARVEALPAPSGTPPPTCCPASSGSWPPDGPASCAAAGGPPGDDPRPPAPACRTNGASLKVFRPILRQFGDGPRLHQARPRSGPALARPRLPAAGAVAARVMGPRFQQRAEQPPAFPRPRRFDLGGERRDGLLGTLETDLPRLDFALAGGHRHDRAQQVVSQQVRPDLLAHHLWTLAAQHVHLHHRLDRADVDLPLPPPLVQPADLPAVYRGVEDRGHHLELLAAVVLLAGIHS